MSILFLALSSCSGDSLKWREEVLLSDGRVITLTRYQEFNGPHELGQPPTASNYWLEFKHPDTGQTVRWEYGRHLGTVALFIHEKTPYLLVKPRYGSSRRDFDCPDPPYLLYRFESTTWQKTDLGNIPVKQLSANMTDGTDGDRKAIIEKKHYLEVEHTRLRYVLNMQPWVIDFGLMNEQTFGHDNCSKRSNYLLVRP